MSIIGRAKTCRWCSALITPDGRGGWIHPAHGYHCRDPWGTSAPNVAEPRPPLNRRAL